MRGLFGVAGNARRRKGPRVPVFVVALGLAVVLVTAFWVVRFQQLNRAHAPAQASSLQPPPPAQARARGPETAEPAQRPDATPATATGLRSAGVDGLLFLSVGDWGGVTKVSRGVAREMANYGKDNGGCSFIWSLGDNFYDDGVTSVHDPQWNSTFHSLFSDPQLRVRWYSCLGNHDHHGNVTAQVAYTHAPDNMGWYMPNALYTDVVQVEEGTSAQFFVLNTYDRKRPLDSQLKWLTGELAKSTADWRFLVNHNPIFSGGSTHGGTTGFGRWAAKTRELERKVLPLLVQYGVHAVFSGDDHTLQILEEQDVAFFVSGAGGGREKGMYHRAKAINQTVFVQQSAGGFMAHHLNRTTLSTRVVKWTGKMLHSHVYHRPPRPRAAA